MFAQFFNLFEFLRQCRRIGAHQYGVPKRVFECRRIQPLTAREHFADLVQQRFTPHGFRNGVGAVVHGGGLLQPTLGIGIRLDKRKQGIDGTHQTSIRLTVGHRFGEFQKIRLLLRIKVLQRIVQRLALEQGELLLVAHAELRRNV